MLKKIHVIVFSGIIAHAVSPHWVTSAIILSILLILYRMEYPHDKVKRYFTFQEEHIDAVVDFIGILIFIFALTFNWELVVIHTFLVSTIFGVYLGIGLSIIKFQKRQNKGGEEC
ncbi:hypothetical protein D4R87_02475 [bacterium]|nr:MAG: hypothetical protein D4R87_02475 [bacterium]